MKKGNNLIRVFTGTEVLVNLLKAELEKAGIPSTIRNDFQVGVKAGFSGGVPSAIDLYIQEASLQKAVPIIDELTK